jgi:hypothetical protein
MKKLKILDSKKNLTIIELEEAMVDAYLESIAASESFGKPEREAPASADFDEADVIERYEHEVSPAVAEVMNDAGEIVQASVPAVTVPMVKLRAEYSIEVSDISVELEQKKASEEALAYLASTDWYVVREMETGVPYSVEIKEKRAEARLKVVR